MNNASKFFLGIFIIGVLLAVIPKLMNSDTDIKSIEKLNQKLKSNKSSYNTLAFGFKILSVEPFEARKFVIMIRAKSIDEFALKDNTNSFTSAGGSRLLVGKHLKATYNLFYSLNVEDLTLYKNKFIQISTDIYSPLLEEYSIIYADNWQNEIPRLLSNYTVITEVDEIEKHDKWILIADEHWGFMN